MRQINRENSGCCFCLKYLTVLFLLSAGKIFAQDQWRLVWADEFEYNGAPDPDKWSYDIGGHGWGNNELQYYTNRTENARVEDSVLIIEVRKEDYENKEYTSARMVTKNKGDWLYGRIEVKAKLPSGKGTWPAIWMLPTDWEYGDWPNSGEIDIMEHVGYDPGIVHSTVHTEAYNHTKGTQVGNNTIVNDCFTKYHVYAVEWYPDRIEGYVDDQKYFTFENENETSAQWPFDKRFHLLLNIAFGGDWGGAQGIDPDFQLSQMIVDYVRVYEPAGSDTAAPVIITHPASVTVNEGDKAVFEVNARGSMIQYQWKKNGADINGATGKTLIIPNVSISDNGVEFFVEVFNSKGTVQSENAELSVKAFEGFKFQKTNQNIIIDGMEDEIFKSVAVENVDKTIIGTPVSQDDFSAGFKGLWDETALYMFVNVTDESLQSGGELTWQDDAVEFYIDADNSKNETYGENDFQFRFSWNSTTPEETKHNAIDGIEYIMVEVESGYVLEAKIPWSLMGVTVEENSFIGFDLHINDSDVSGVRDTKIAWHSTQDNTYQNPSFMGTVQLIDSGSPVKNRKLFDNTGHHNKPSTIISIRHIDIHSSAFYDLSGRLLKADYMNSNRKILNRIIVKQSTYVK